MKYKWKHASFPLNAIAITTNTKTHRHCSYLTRVRIYMSKVEKRCEACQSMYMSIEYKNSNESSRISNSKNIWMSFSVAINKNAKKNQQLAFLALAEWFWWIYSVVCGVTCCFVCNVRLSEAFRSLTKTCPHIYHNRLIILELQM